MSLSDEHSKKPIESVLARHRDGLGNVSESHPDLNVSFEDKYDAFRANFTTTSKSAVQVVLELLQSREERSITYIALGPLTGLALLMRQHREVVRKRIGKVVIMGGALDVPGNATPVAECRVILSLFCCLLTCQTSVALPSSQYICRRICGERIALP